jgi:hypothetical protein
MTIKYIVLGEDEGPMTQQPDMALVACCTSCKTATRQVHKWSVGQAMHKEQSVNRGTGSAAYSDGQLGFGVSDEQP